VPSAADRGRHPELVLAVTPSSSGSRSRCPARSLAVALGAWGSRPALVATVMPARTMAGPPDAGQGLSTDAPEDPRHGGRWKRSWPQAVPGCRHRIEPWSGAWPLGLHEEVEVLARRPAPRQPPGRGGTPPRPGCPAGGATVAA
jgi:hypothetical protein